MSTNQKSELRCDVCGTGPRPTQAIYCIGKQRLCIDHVDSHREWPQDELREHLREAGFPMEKIAPGEVIPQCVKLAHHGPVTEEDREWARFWISKLRGGGDGA